MRVSLFSGAKAMHALTREMNGANLPGHLGPWKQLRSVRLCGDLPDEKRAIELVTEYGFCCFD